jgi:phosphoserine phosphatase
MSAAVPTGSAGVPPAGAAGIDLVIQSDGLSAQAIEAFEVALPAPPCRRRAGAARFPGVPDDARTRAVAVALAEYWRCDAAFVPARMRSADFRALVMDMDSTVITIECIDEVARFAGKGEAVAAITEAAMRGEIADYAESLRRRVALLAGTDAGVLERVRSERLRLSPGAPALLAAARARGWRTLLVSGGFTVFAGAVGRDLGFDATCANELLVRDGRLTGEVCGPPENGGEIVDAAGKARALQRLCDAIGCAPSAAIAVGDGANDLQMLGAAGLSVAYRAKPLVRARASHALDHCGLDGLLALFSDSW